MRRAHLAAPPTPAARAARRWEAKLADFNLSRALREGEAAAQLSQLINSPEWSAPERLAGQLYGKAADVFSFGVILYGAAARPRCCPAPPLLLQPQPLKAARQPCAPRARARRAARRFAVVGQGLAGRWRARRCGVCSAGQRTERGQAPPKGHCRVHRGVGRGRAPRCLDRAEHTLRARPPAAGPTRRRARAQSWSRWRCRGRQ